ncbi:B12-binding domain-containing radical SAM protein [Aporhodopirellula aestuarii]|uniref:B12-binding domain-containing radical SAM protein n=1 Tax=Aporhodopirellula aestuarii TaxID=2950107 RepID=A0ABT0UBH6_9BACT|nr:radical SAM protein [Aporhodopirellula aestuarii]MCM2373855.1 B12-binding domain-containing radical SAM protein [Aporhodopirellula aestuarii]
MRTLPEDPDQPLRCLLIQPLFEQTNYWNFVESARAIGAKATAPPLGLMTVAALLPQAWEFEIADLNVAPLDPTSWERADIICTGGMLPQQPGILELVARARAEEKFVVVGGPDPTSQPQIYQEADAIVMGEGELTIPMWLEAWRDGNPRGVFETAEKPDVTKTPVPRFDLIDFNDYLHVGLQSSRGCPYNCEFCDIIELFGRRPRVKKPEQFLAELQRLYDLGYRGWVDFTDDNFIGNRKLIKPLLVALKSWNEQHNYPFVFSTEASINLADDEELLQLMQDVQFRYVFLGIESPDEETLIHTQKRINTVQPIIDRVRKIYDYGISVAAGLIIGFDTDKPGTDGPMIRFIQESGISLSMVGLLSALPNTQLTRRLTKERRLIDSEHRWIDDPEASYELRSAESKDQTISGLNFVTTRDRVEIYQELRNIIEVVYSPRAFMDRVLDTTARLNIQNKHVPNMWEFRRMWKGFRTIAWRMLADKRTRWLYVRNFFKAAAMGPTKFEYAHTITGTFLHFDLQTQRMLDALDVSIDFAKNHATYPRSVAEIPAPDGSPQSANLAIADVSSCATPRNHAG